MNIKKLFKLTGAMILLAATLNFTASCSGKSGRIIRVGVLFPMTGDLADKGIDSVRALEMAADEINRDGGIKSMNGAMIELIYGDTKGNPDSGAAEAERLITRENVSVIIGTYQSSVTKVATQVAERFETPFIVSISLADIITERGFRYTFRVVPKAQYYGREQVQFLVESAKNRGFMMRRVALLHENTDFGTATSLAQKKALAEYGIEISADVSYVAEGARDLRAEVSRVIASAPDAILTTTYLNDSVLIYRELARRRIQVPVIDTAGGTVSPDFIKLLGADSENVFTSAEFSKYTESGRDLNRRFNSRYGVDITGDSAYAYQSMWVLRDALERAGTNDRIRLRDAIASTDMGKGEHMILPTERIRFGSDGQNINARLFIVQIQDGEYIPVWPLEYSTGKAKFRR